MGGGRLRKVVANGGLTIIRWMIQQSFVLPMKEEKTNKQTTSRTNNGVNDKDEAIIRF